MKIQCNVCEAAEAAVLCCADEAALCWACDEKIHTANKLASMHQRVPLSSSSSQMPKCDICQETVGYFFCLEDRALLCRKCDVAIHTANAYVSAHQRFLLTGVKVGLEPTEPVASSSSGKSVSREKVPESEARSFSRRDSLPLAGQYNEVLPNPVGGVGDFASSKVLYTGGSFAGIIPQWPIDEYLGLPEYNQNYGYLDNGSSKADSGKLGESDSPILRAFEEELDDDECLGQVPEASWAVPQVPSPPTASGLYWPKNYQNALEGTVFVPDICHSRAQNPIHYQHNGTISKRRRQL
ncbi:LOW QUALITY PROTEIN: B-box zinc finger protein 22-like [Juglans microcarpa x Juglans regia]|uniref:LOW QUALITY PROTEIN: B-box zinc finger protein 22-like n=1 Tax=Juglans microcarpa x Juglans regia TaxID=2249226 RepID=UPI001B7E3BFA|nr:LOW QUALITY PROTEIN: B-box zinc finger protein 22-like [Juglans microcarpa x Juglans regia]